jgi:hypothetical protein
MKINFIAITILLLTLSSICFSQQTNTVTINYETGWQGNLNHTSCNIFNISPPSIINGFTHYPISGGAF